MRDAHYGLGDELVAAVIEFFVPGIPQPQGSKTGFVQGGRAVVVDKNPKLLKPWRKAVTSAAAEAWAGRDPLERGVIVRATFGMPKGKSVKRHEPFVRPDLDKLARSLLDGVTDAGLWKDDSQVVELAIRKIYADPPGVRVRIETSAA